MIKLLAVLFCITIGLEGSAQEDKIEWLSFEEAVKRNDKVPKKFIVNIYTDWCGWCKKMDASTFKNQAVIKYIQSNYWAVKLNAERKDTVILGQQMFVNENTDQRRGAHQLAIALLNGKMTYPTMVYLDEKVELMHPPIAGYQDAKSLEEIIHYFGDGFYQSTPWDKYLKEFKSAIGQQ
jgi:thioredoxin-related protein